MKRTPKNTKIGERMLANDLSVLDGTDCMIKMNQNNAPNQSRSSTVRLVRSMLIVAVAMVTLIGCTPFGRDGAPTPTPMPVPETSYGQSERPSGALSASSSAVTPVGFQAGVKPSYAVQQAGYEAGLQTAGGTATQADHAQADYHRDSATRSYGVAPVGGQIESERYTARQFPGDGTVGSGTFDAPNFDDFGNVPNGGAPVASGPRVREADLIVQGYPARTGRITLGGAVNSDAGVTGQITVDERNFDILRWPRSFQDLASGTAFRGAGQTFRLEAAPGNQFQRYTASFSDPNLFGYLPISMSVSGFLFDRRFNDWDEERLGGRLSFGYRLSSFLSISAGISGQSVELTNPRVLGVSQLDNVLGSSHGLYSGEVSLKHDTRNTPLQASSGHYFEFSYEEVFGDFDFSRFNIEYRKYLLLNERVDGTGKQTLSFSTRAGFSGEDTPIFENYYAGGYATMRGFDFRGASPQISGVEVGGRFQFLNSVEYMFPLTADDAFRGVLFTDFGTVEQDIELNEENFRVAPGFGFRIAIPALGPAPLAFDFAFPVASAATDEERMFSFYMSAIR